MSTPLPSTADGPAPIAWIVFAGGCRVALGGLFLFAAITKIIDLAGFEDRLFMQSPLPIPFASAVARILPWLELTLAFCLLLGRAVREAALLAAILLAAFLIYTAFFATTADCGCLLFPITESAPPRSWLLVRDVLALAVAIVTAFSRHRSHELFTTESRRTQSIAARHEGIETKDRE
jgi:putative oxidoreductase